MQQNFIWHPFTQEKNASPPIHIESAKGTILYGTDGSEYIDAISSWWVNIHGHAHEAIAERIALQAKKLEHVIFAGFTHEPAISLAESIIKILPAQFAKVFFSDNGSTTVEVAIKMAIQYWYNKGFTQKTKVIAFQNSYHGDTFGAMSVGARNNFNAAFRPLLFDVIYLPVPTVQNIKSLKKQLSTLVFDERIAAFIFEPLVQGAGGMLMYEARYLDELLEVAREKNIICIADEVMTGFGRTGKNFAIEHLQTKPDIICLSKGITGGFLPLGLTVCTQKIYDAFYSEEVEKTFFHGHSYTANPLSCAAAIASIQLLLTSKCQEQIASICKSHAQFAVRISGNKMVTKVRQTGTILAFEIKTDDETSYFNSVKSLFYGFFVSKGVLLRPLGNVAYIMPPYCITETELEKVYTTIEESLFFFENIQSNRSC